MRILTVTPYITSEALSCFKRNKTGFGYMVHDISTSITESGNVVDSVTYNYRHKRIVIDGICYLECSLWHILLQLTKCISIRHFFLTLKNYKLSTSNMIRLLYCWFLTGYLKELIRQSNYDIVHFHSINYATNFWIAMCKELNQPYLITLHALTSFSDTVKIESEGKKYERDFFNRVISEKIPITVVGSGMKHLIEKTCNIGSCENIMVVLNAFTVSQNINGKYYDIRKKYSLPSDSKIILYVGNVCERKNQNQLITAFDYLPDNIKNNLYILFLGESKEPGYKIEELIKNSSYQDHFKYCGVVPKKELAEYYNQGNAVALLSLSEAFGLSLVEGMFFGLPCIAFDDIDAIADIYDESSMVCVEEHNDSAVAKGIVTLLSKQWSKQAIRAYSEKFDRKKMAEAYIRIYEKLIKR